MPANPIDMNITFLRKLVLGIYLAAWTTIAQAQLYPGQFAPSFSAKDIDGHFHSVEQYKGKKILMTFYRNVSSMPSVARFLELEREKEYFRGKDIVMLAVFPSTRENLKLFRDTAAYYQVIISDSEQVLYRLFELGQQSSFRPNIRIMPKKKEKSDEQADRIKNIKEGKLSEYAPADILIDAGGNIIMGYYGKSETDHISVLKLKTLIDTL